MEVARRGFPRQPLRPSSGSLEVAYAAEKGQWEKVVENRDGVLRTAPITKAEITNDTEW